MNPVATEMASVIPPSPSSFSVKTKNMTHSTPKPTSSLSKPPLNLTDFKHLPGNPTQESGESGSVPAIQEAEAADTDGWGMQAAVFDMGKNLASKIQTLVSTNVTLQSWTQGEKTPDAIVKYVTEVVNRQNAINKASLNLNTINYALNIANSSANNQLRTKLNESTSQVSHLETSLVECKTTIEELNESVIKLEDESEYHKERSSELQKALDRNTKELANTLEAYHVQRKEREAAERQQLRLARRLAAGEAARVSFTDSILGLISYWIVNTVLVDAPLRLTLVLAPKGKVRKWLRQCTKLMLIVYLMRTMRDRLIGGQGITRSPTIVFQQSYNILVFLYHEFAAKQQNNQRSQEPVCPATPWHAKATVFHDSGSVGLATPSQWNVD
eukprot:m.66720 g.66720  ORF g.66720 m.66720 type:complete len:386 (-) comp11828_c0_seq2:33-1190(-)